MTLAIMLVTMLLRMVMDGDVDDDAEDGADDYDGAMMTTAMMMDGNMKLRMDTAFCRCNAVCESLS